MLGAMPRLRAAAAKPPRSTTFTNVDIWVSRSMTSPLRRRCPPSSALRKGSNPGLDPASLQEDPNRLPDRAVHLHRIGRRSQSEQYLQVEVVAQHADEPLSGMPGIVLL